MLRRLCIAAAAAVLGEAAHAEDYCGVISPCKIPAAYQQGQFLARPVVRDLPYRTLQERCGTIDVAATGESLGCAVFQGSECHVFLPSEFRQRLPDFYKMIREHELAHCRGWRHG